MARGMRQTLAVLGLLLATGCGPSWQDRVWGMEVYVGDGTGAAVHVGFADQDCWPVEIAEGVRLGGLAPDRVYRPPNPQGECGSEVVAVFADTQALEGEARVPLQLQDGDSLLIDVHLENHPFSKHPFALDAPLDSGDPQGKVVTATYLGPGTMTSGWGAVHYLDPLANDPEQVQTLRVEPSQGPKTSTFTLPLGQRGETWLDFSLIDPIQHPTTADGHAIYVLRSHPTWPIGFEIPNDLAP